MYREIYHFQVLKSFTSSLESLITSKYLAFTNYTNNQMDNWNSEKQVNLPYLHNIDGFFLVSEMCIGSCGYPGERWNTKTNPEFQTNRS